MRKTVLVGIVLLIALAMIGQAIADGEGPGSSTSPAANGTNASTGRNVSTGTPEVIIAGIGAGPGEAPGISSRAGGIFGRVGRVGYTGFGPGGTGAFGGMGPGVFNPGFTSLDSGWNRLYGPVAGYNY